MSEHASLTRIRFPSNKFAIGFGWFSSLAVVVSASQKTDAQPGVVSTMRRDSSLRIEDDTDSGQLLT